MNGAEDAGGTTPRGKPIWLKVVGIGCGAVIVLMLIAAGLIAANWSRLSGLYGRTRTAFADMMKVQSGLHEKYEADVRVNMRRESGVQGSILSVTLINAPVMDRIKVDGDEGRRTALEVAATVRDMLPPAGRYDNYEVEFARDAGSGGAVLSGSWKYRFSAADLPAERSVTPR
jgi:hypothetical protein